MEFHTRLNDLYGIYHLICRFLEISAVEQCSGSYNASAENRCLAVTIYDDLLAGDIGNHLNPGLILRNAAAGDDLIDLVALIIEIA